jgi:hypothetical protein
MKEYNQCDLSGERNGGDYNYCVEKKPLSTAHKIY